MEYADGKVKDLQIAYIGGGSRGWAWTFMTDLAMDEELSGTIRLYDIDAEAAKHNEIIGNRLSAREDVVGKWNYTVSDSLQSALTGADFIVSLFCRELLMRWLWMYICRNDWESTSP